MSRSSGRYVPSSRADCNSSWSLCNNSSLWSCNWSCKNCACLEHLLTTARCSSTCVVCCSVLQYVAVCCSVLQCVAVCCSELQCVTVCCQTAARIFNTYRQPHAVPRPIYSPPLCFSMSVCCSVLQRVSVCSRVLQCVAVYCSVLQSVLQQLRVFLTTIDNHVLRLDLAIINFE